MSQVNVNEVELNEKDEDLVQELNDTVAKLHDCLSVLNVGNPLDPTQTAFLKSLNIL